MKHISALLLTILLALVLAGCGNTERGESSAPTEPNQTAAVPTDTPFNTETPISAEEANYWGHYLIEDNYFSQGNLETKPGVYRQTTVAVLLAVSVFLLLAGCGENTQYGDSAIQTDAPHTFAGYPVVYLTADISAQGLLSAYEALEPAENETVGIKLSETLSEGFSWQDLTAELVQATDTSIIDGRYETDFSSYDSTVILTHFESHDTVGLYGTTAHMASYDPVSLDQGPC